MIPVTIARPKLSKVPIRIYSVNLRLLRSFRSLNRKTDLAVISNPIASHRPKIIKVNYPGLNSFRQYELGQTQMSGYSGLLSCELATADIEEIKAFVDSLYLFKLGVSWGGHDSLVYAPVISYLKELN